MSLDQSYSFDDVEKIKDFLISKTKIRPTIGIICGSGLGGLVDNVVDKDVFNYADIPHFPATTVVGHAGKLVFGVLSGKNVVCLQGRFHYYEGHNMQKCGLPVRVMAMLGVKTLVVTNAAGGINRDFNVGDIMVIKDHIGLPLMAGTHPLVGLNDERFGARFPSLNSTYDRDYRNLALKIAQESGYGDFTRSGVYCMVSGPSYETPAEIRLLNVVGADAVGMSTVPEVAVAGHMGLKCLGISLITNKCIMEYDLKEETNHAEVLQVADKRSACILDVVTKFVQSL